MHYRFQRINDAKELSFTIPYVIYLITFMLEVSFYAKYISRVTTAIYGFCMAWLVVRELILGKTSPKGMLASLFILSMMFIGLRVRRVNIVNIMIFIIAGRNIEFETIAKKTIITTSIMLAIIILSALSGLIENYSSVRIAQKVRYYLGFRYALFAPGFFTNIAMLVVYLKKERIKIKQLLLILLIAFGFYKSTDSRLSFYLTIIICLVAFVFKIAPDFLKKKRWLCVTMCLSFILFAGVSFYITLTYNSSVNWQRSLNRILAGRLQYGQLALGEYGISMFGQQIKWLGNGLDIYGRRAVGNYMYVDCLYIQILLNYGIVFFLLFITFFTITSFITLRNKNYWLLTMLFFLALHCVIDDNGLNLAYCTFWFAISDLLLKTRKAIGHTA